MSALDDLKRDAKCVAVSYYARPVLLILLVCALVLLMACGSGATVPTAGTSTIAGTYTLASVNGKSMPYSPTDGVTYVRGTLTLQSDSTFIDVQVIQFFQTMSTEQRYGVFSLIGDSVVFTMPAYRAPFTMRWAQDTLRAVWSDGLFVYRR